MNGVANEDRRRAKPSAKLLIDVFLLILLIGVTILTYEQSGLRYVKPVAENLSGFWASRARELCVDIGPPPTPPAKPDPVVHLAWLYGSLLPYGSRVWDAYSGCLEPREETVGEDLLHFRVNKFDEFEGDPSRGFARVHHYVEQYIKARSDIYIVGHTDETFTADYNALLSFRRAYFIAQNIEVFLRAKGLRSGADFRLFPLGMGKSQLLSRLPGESQQEWWARCRRIGLSFRAAKSSGGRK